MSSRLFQPYTGTAPGPIRDEEPESSPFLKLPDIPSRQYADLRNHPDFAAVKAQFLSDIDEMDELATMFVGGDYTEAIATFRNHINEPPETFEGGMFPIFEETRHQIHKIVARIKAHSSEEPVSPADNMPERDRIILALHLCLNEIDHCPAGVQSRFSRAWQSLEAEPEQLDARLFLTRRKILEEFSHNYLRLAVRDGGLNVQPNDEIHWVNALFNAECSRYGLPPVADLIAPHLSPDILHNFRSGLSPLLNDYTVLHTLASDYYQRFCHFLAQKNLSHWRTGKIPPGQLISKHTDDLEQAVLTPMNQLCDIREKEKGISLGTIIELDGDQYSFVRCREKIHGWLTRTILDAPAILFTRIPGPDRPQRYICTYNDLFFWIFETDCPARLGLYNFGCPFDAEASKPLMISDLSAIDIYSWPEHVQLAILSQAMEQTGVTTEDARSMAVFLLGKRPGRALSTYPDSVQNAVASQLSEKMTASPEFAEEFATTFCQSFTGTIPRWMIETPLLEPLLAVQWVSGEETCTITDSLNFWQLSTFSSSSLKNLLTPDKCQDLFLSALDRELGGFLWRLLKTGHCNTMNNHLNHGATSVLMVLCKHGIADGVDYLLNPLHKTDVNSKDTYGWTALHLAAYFGHTECLEKLLAMDGIAIYAKDDHGYTALHNAASRGSVECLIKLLARDNSGLNEKSERGTTALHYAARGHTECLKVLLQMHTIEVNARDNEGFTPLMDAAGETGKIDCVRLLLNHEDTDPNMMTIFEDTAHIIARFYEHHDIMDMLENDPRYKP